MRIARYGKRLGFVLVVALFLLWTIPNIGGEPEPTIQIARAAQAVPTATVTRGFAIVNPANVQLEQMSIGQSTPDATTQSANIERTTNISGAAASSAVQPGTARQPSIVSAPSLVRPGSLPLAESASFDLVAADKESEENSIGVAEVTSRTDAPANEPILPIVAAGVSRSIVAALLVPTPTFEPVPTREVPLAQLVREIEFKLPGGITATPTSTPSPTPTPVPVFLTAGRLWSNFSPRPATENDHFWIGRPFPEFVASQIASPSYQFGSTAGNRYRVHHGIDTSNPVGTPVQAATNGEVIHAGWDDPDILGPYGGFYGNAVVIRLDQRLPVAGGELDVFLLYGHLNEVLVAKGQRVIADDIVGRVGMTGIAIGPHLHTEVRLRRQHLSAQRQPIPLATAQGQRRALSRSAC